MSGPEGPDKVGHEPGAQRLLEGECDGAGAGVDELAHGGDSVVELVQQRVDVPLEYRARVSHPQRPAGAALLHSFHDQADQVHRPDHIRAPHGVHLGFLEVCELPGVKAGGVVDQDIDRSKLIVDLRDDRLYLRFLRHVALDEQHLTIFRANRGCQRFCKLSICSVMDRQRCSLTGEP